MAGQKTLRLGALTVSMYRPLLWSWGLRTRKNAWVARVQISRGWRRDLLFGVASYIDGDDERTIDVGFWPFRWTLHQCELVPVPSEQLKAWAAMEVD